MYKHTLRQERTPAEIELIFCLLETCLGYPENERDAELIINWLFNNTHNVSQPMGLQDFPNELLPDICTCGSYFGETMCGRLRLGCPSCKGHHLQTKHWSWQRFTKYPAASVTYLRLVQKHRRFL